MDITRRNVAAAALSAAAIGLGGAGRAQTPMSMPMDDDDRKPGRPAVPRLPVILCRSAATIPVQAAYRALHDGEDTLDAILRIARAQEDNPDDPTTGLGGLPDRDGTVQLDACCFHGPSRRSGTVSGLGDVRQASMVARAVMRQADGPILTGPDAQRFATARGVPTEPLTTDRTRRIWQLWRQVQAAPLPSGPLRLDPAPGADPASGGKNGKPRFLPASQDDFNLLVNRIADAGARLGIEPQWTWSGAAAALFPAAAALHVSAANAKHEMSCVSTSSGLPWRPPGACGDVAVPGAGCYLDPDVGSAGASGNAEANIRIAGAALIVDNMRRGLSPEEAGMDALRRIAAWYRHDMNALRFVEIVYYVLRRDGAYAGVSLWEGNCANHKRSYVVHDGSWRSEACLFLFKGGPLSPSPA